MKGILFKDEMVRPILNTKLDTWPAKPINDSLPFKWQTRRAVKPQPKLAQEGWTWKYHYSGESAIRRLIEEKPRYKLGEVLYVKEVFSRDGCACYEMCSCPAIVYRADMPPDIHKEDQPRWTSSLIMPATAARLWVKVMDIGVEMVKDISEEDCLAEGISPSDIGELASKTLKTYVGETKPATVLQYFDLYNRINGAGASEKDWCFKYSLQRVSKPQQAA